MDDLDTIIETRQGTICVIKYNRPKKKNAINMDMYLRVTRILKNVAQDESISVAVLTGVGDYFSSGNDVLDSAKARALKDTRFISVLKDFISAFITFPKILVAVVNGPAIGIAATTLALCDLVFASENSFFSTPFTKLGIVAEGCSTYTFPRLIGERKAVEMLILNHKMSAAEALQYGFVNYVYKPEDLHNKVWDKINELATLPIHSVLVQKKLIRGNIKDKLIETNNKEIEGLNIVWNSQPLVNSKL